LDAENQGLGTLGSTEEPIVSYLAKHYPVPKTAPWRRPPLPAYRCPSETVPGTCAAQSIAYAATITLDARLSERVIVGALTGNLTINAPTNPRTGAMLVFSFAQDATGGRTMSWNSVFKKAADGAGAANQKGATSFVYDGANWVQVGGALLWL
jgi:hypothetical protein